MAARVHADGAAPAGIDQLLAAQRARLERVPPDLERHRRLLQEQLQQPTVAPNPSSPFVYRREALAAMAGGAGAEGQPDARAVLASFDAQLAARGVRLTVVLVPPRPALYAHSQLPGVGPEAELWPELTAIVIDLLESGVEVLDLRDAFVDGGEGVADATPPAMHRWDHHWTSAGMATAARLVAEQLRGADEEGALPPPAAGRFARSVSTVAAPDGLLPGGAQPPVMATTQVTLIRDLQHTPPAGIGPVLVFGDSQAIVGTAYPDGTGFANHLAAELGFAVPYAGQAAPASVAVGNYVRWFGHVEPQPEAVVLVIDAAALVRDDWRPAELPAVPLVTGPAGPVPLDTMADDGTRYRWLGSAGPVASQRMLARVVTVSAPPEPFRVLYGDALSVAEVEPVAPLGPRRGRLAILDYVARDGDLTDFADVAVGDRWWLRLLPLAAGESEALRTTMVVDDTDGFDLERFFVAERSPAVEPLPPAVGHRHELGPAEAPVWVIGAGAVAAWPRLLPAPLASSRRSAAPGEGAAQALWRLERAAQAGGDGQRHPEAIALVPGDADLREHGNERALGLVSQLTEAAALLFPHARLLLTTVVPDGPRADDAIANVAALNAELVERYRRGRRIELVDLSAAEWSAPRFVARALAATIASGHDAAP